MCLQCASGTQFYIAILLAATAGQAIGNRPVYSVATEDILASMWSWSCQTIESCRGLVFSRAWQETLEK